MPNLTAISVSEWIKMGSWFRWFASDEMFISYLRNKVKDLT